MKTQKRKLQFGKSSITELNDLQSLEIVGGTDTTTNGQTTIHCSHCIPDPITSKLKTIIGG